MSKRCCVACESTGGVLSCELELAETATVADALAAARALLGEVIDWQHASVGVYGRLCTREQVPADGDRIELYRALLVDPRAARRARVTRLRRVRDT